MSSPAQIIRRLLIQLNLVPSNQTSEWAAFVALLPDSPDTSVAIYDTAPVQQGRIMRTGEKIEKPGIQIRFRSGNYPAAYDKASSVANALDQLPSGTMVRMVPDAETWSIQNISRTSGILTTGIEEEGDRKRHNLTINAIITMRKVED